MTSNTVVTVAAAGTRVQVSATNVACFTVTVQSPSTNSGIIYLGGKTVSSTNGQEIISPGDSFTFPPGESNCYSLSDFWVDAATSGDKAKVMYSVR